MSHFKKVEQFAEPFDPGMEQPSAEERLKAAVDFSLLIEQSLLAHFEDITVGGDTTGDPDAETYSFEIFASERRARGEEYLKVTISESPGRQTLKVQEQKMGEGQGDRAIYTLKAGADQVIRSFGPEKLAPHSGVEETMKALDTIVENFKLRVAMGYDNQPIGPEEIQKLRAILL